MAMRMNPNSKLKVVDLDKELEEQSKELKPLSLSREEHD